MAGNLEAIKAYDCFVLDFCQTGLKIGRHIRRQYLFSLVLQKYNEMPNNNNDDDDNNNMWK